MEHETLSREEVAILLARPEKEAEMRREKVNTEGKEKLLEGIKRGIGQNIDAAFDRGYRKGYADGYERGHADGYEACKWDTELIPELKKEEYERGYADGYANGQLSTKEAAEEEIKVGDEVRNGGVIGIVSLVKNNDDGICYHTIGDNGHVWYLDDKATKPTGRHFPQIAEVLEQMKEHQK